MQKKKILIVEDNPDERLLTRTVLTHAGYAVLEANCAADGIDLAIKEVPDLILMDIRLPQESKGIGAARTLRDDVRTKDIPIIFLTAYIIYKNTAEIRNTPNSELLLKSADPKTLLKTIEKFLQKK